MPRFEKWLTAVGPNAPVPRAARQALRLRLRAVAHYLKVAARPSGQTANDAEAVHQLRVWTRRTSAALRLFRDLLPRRTAQWLKRKLREIRRTAGYARDCDVLAARLENGEVPGLEHAATQLRAQRHWAESGLSALVKSLLRRGRWQRKSAKLLKKIRWKDVPPAQQLEFGPWCRDELAALLTEFLRLAEADVTRNAPLHELRIAGKRLRYVLELAAGCIPQTTHRRLYAELTDLQDRLGHVCDHIATIDRLKQWRQDATESTSRKQLRSAIVREQSELAAAKKRLFRWWTLKRQQGMQRRWQKAIGKTSSRVLQ